MMKIFNIFKKKVNKEEPVNNLPELLMIKLFFVNKPVIDDIKIKACLEKRFDNVGVSDSNKESRQYFFKEYEVEFEEGKIPVQGGLFVPDKEGIDFQELQASFHQSWNWPGAMSVVEKCKYELLLTDILSRNLDYKLRLEFFQKYVASIVEAINPMAVWISNTDKIVEPKEYLGYFADAAYKDLNPFVNVRLFKVEESNGQMIMDTLGLNTLGLPDFEIKFSDYDPSITAGLLFKYGSYIFNNGVVIENGNTIQGIQEDQKWKCFLRDSLIGPNRKVFHIEH